MDALEGFALTFGWISLILLGLRFYFQIYLNYRFRSVAGLDFGFILFNFVFSVYALLFVMGLFFSSGINSDFTNKYHRHHDIAVKDVIFALNSMIACIFLLYQTKIYDWGTQRIHWFSVIIISMLTLIVLFLFLFESICQGNGCWGFFFSFLSSAITAIQLLSYVPQILWNYLRKSTLGFSLGYILSDIFGNACSMSQIAFESGEGGDWSSLDHHTVSLISTAGCLFLSLLLLTQHFWFFPVSPELNMFSDRDVETMVEGYHKFSDTASSSSPVVNAV